MIRNAAEFTFSWSLRRQEMWNCCRRKYFLHYYAARGGHDPDSGGELRRLHEMRSLLSERAYGPFDDAAGTQQRVAGIPHVEGDPRVAPVVEIFRDIDMHADLSQIPGASRDFMFPVPVNPAAVPQQAAAVRVDMSSAVVRPEFAGVERVKHGHDEFPPVPLFFRLSDRVIITRNPCFSSAE